MLLALDAVPGFSIVLAHNRDEFFNRPFAGPKFAPEPVARVFPEDKVASGTWFGVNESGIAVAITNRIGAAREMTRRSRGLLCADLLLVDSLDAARVQVQKQVARYAYNGFNVVIAQHGKGILCAYDDDMGLAVETLSAGVHMLTSQHGLNPAVLDADRQEFINLAPSPAAFRGRLQQWLQDKTLRSPWYAICKDFDGYGTVCSTQLWYAQPTAQPTVISELLYAPGAPASTPFTKVPVPFFSA